MCWAKDHVTAVSCGIVLTASYTEGVVKDWYNYWYNYWYQNQVELIPYSGNDILYITKKSCWEKMCKCDLVGMGRMLTSSKNVNSPSVDQINAILLSLLQVRLRVISTRRWKMCQCDPLLTPLPEITVSGTKLVSYFTLFSRRVPYNGYCVLWAVCVC